MLPLILADIADVPSDWLKWLVVVLIAVATPLITLLKKPVSPVVTKEADEYATAEGVQKLSQRIDTIEREISGFRQSTTDRLHNMETAILAKGEERAIGIHGRIEPLAATVHEISGQMDTISRLVHDLLSRVPASVRKG